MIDLCVLTETLVIDAEGVYDPRSLNDRMLLGLKGTMSEFEIGIPRQRAQEAYRQKIQRGEVMTMVPVGYERSGSIGIEMTPDRPADGAGDTVHPPNLTGCKRWVVGNLALTFIGRLGLSWTANVQSSPSCGPCNCRPCSTTLVA